MKTKEYICYDNRTDEILAMGTARECAKQLGMNVSSFHSQKTAFKNRNIPGKARRNVHLDIYEVEDER